MSQCLRKRWEKLICIGVPGWGRNQPTCKAEYWRFTSRKLDSHTFGQRHYYYFADMSQHWGMSDPHFWGFGLTGTCAEGWGIQNKKTWLSHFGHRHFGDISQYWGMSGLHYLGVLVPREGKPTFWGCKAGRGLTHNSKNRLLHFCDQWHAQHFGDIFIVGEAASVTFVQCLRLKDGR